MSIKITIPNTSSDVLTFGSANTPTAAQIAGIDSGSSNGQLALYTTASGTSTERVRVDASGNVGIGTSSPTSLGANFKTLELQAGSSSAGGGYYLTGNGTAQAQVGVDTLTGYIGMRSNHPVVFTTNNTERARIDSSGNLLVGCTAYPSATVQGFVASVGGLPLRTSTGTYTGAGDHIQFYNGNGSVGYIRTNGTATSYVTSSDYRLKENIQPMQSALATVAQLSPVTYTWKADGSTGQGFIAHELQAVVPDCVTGEKDAVDAEGNPVYQGIDTSFLVATLTAAIQEQQALITQLQADVAALKGASA